MDLSRHSLAEIRARFDSLRSESSRRRYLVALCRDRRRGARLLAETLERRAQAARAERRRLAGLFALRQRLFTAGARYVAGVDEVGVGTLAGPVVAAAVVLPERVDLPGLDDSKRVPAPMREQLAARIREQAIAWAVAEVDAAEVDRLNILRATLEAMRQSVCALEPTPDHVLVDARTVPDLSMPQTALIGGDARDGSIAAASIVAKVHRDALMCSLHERYPGYGFRQHKGYGTSRHLAALRRLGPSQIHRRSFAPVSQFF